MMDTEKEVPLHQEGVMVMHGNEKAASENSLGEWTEEDEKRIKRRMDWRIVPTVFALYLLCFIDRANVG